MSDFVLLRYNDYLSKSKPFPMLFGTDQVGTDIEINQTIIYNILWFNVAFEN